MHTTDSGFAPQPWARAGGLAYLVIIVFGFAGEMLIRNQLIVPGNPAETVSNILAHPVKWRIGIAGDLTMHFCDGIVATVYYFLFRRVNKPVALMALFMGLVQTAVLVANKMTLVIPLLLISDAPYLGTLNPGQVNTFAYLSIVAHGYGFGIGLIFFGCECLLQGWLIIRSGFLPRVIGFMIQFAGVCYLVNSFSLLLAPGLADALFPFIMLPPLIAESAIALWLVIKGVNLKRWHDVRGVTQRG